MKKDPKVRSDGLCALPSCRKPRNPERSLKYGGIESVLDPWCSSDCCREYHGVPIQSYAPPRPKGVQKYDDGGWRRERLRRQKRLAEGHKPSAANYRNGCRCEGCREQYRIWQKARRERKAA